MGPSGVRILSASWIFMEPRTGTQRGRILELLRNSEQGLTDEAMQDLLGMNPNSQRPRRNELVAEGWVVDSGERRSTKGKSNAIVWVAATHPGADSR